MSFKRAESLNAQDFYPTPPWCYENLQIDWSQFKSAHEPCRGDGRIQEFLIEKGIPTTYSEIMEHKDFFDWNDNVDLILTNPPFSLLPRFAEHSIKHANTVMFLLRINYLGSIKRQKWWQDNPLAALHVISKRPSFTGGGTDATEYAWFIWDNTDRIERGIFHTHKIPTSDQTAEANQMAYTTEELQSELTEYEIINSSEKNSS